MAVSSTIWNGDHGRRAAVGQQVDHHVFGGHDVAAASQDSSRSRTVVNRIGSPGLILNGSMIVFMSAIRVGRERLKVAWRMPNVEHAATSCFVQPCLTVSVNHRRHFRMASAARFSCIATPPVYGFLTDARRE